MDLETAVGVSPTAVSRRFLSLQRQSINRLHSSPKDGGWQWGLELQSCGMGEQQTALTGVPAVQAAGPRLSYPWDANVQEWFVNDKRGLEHGFTVNEGPAAAPAPDRSASQLSTLNSKPSTLHSPPTHHSIKHMKLRSLFTAFAIDELRTL